MARPIRPLESWSSLLTNPSHSPLSGARRLGLFATAFGAGFAVLTIEIAGARLIAPAFGLSAVPWTAVIGVILTALALGSHFGGRMADRGRISLSSLLLGAGLTTIVPVLGRSAPYAALGELGFITGAVATAVVLFAPPVFFLGAVVPYLIRADTEDLGWVGRRAGDVSAAATAGSIAGTFTTGFVLLPLMPLSLLLGLTAAALFGMALLAGRLLGEKPPGDVLLVCALVAGGTGLARSRLPPGVLHDEETLYASVQVTETDWGDGRMVRELIQNGGSSSAEYVDTGEPAHRYVPVSLEILAPVMAGSTRVLVLGGAAESLPVALRSGWPRVPVDVVEIDPVVTELARRYFTFGKRPRPGISVFHGDARLFLRRGSEEYDLIYLDVFDNLVTVPWTMVTEEAVRLMEARLAPGGVLAANVLTPVTGAGADFLRRYAATLGLVFGSVAAYRVDPDVSGAAIQNVLVVAARTERGSPRPDRPPLQVREGARVLTDDWAPVEYLQARIFAGGLRWN